LLDDHSPVGYTSDDLIRRLDTEFKRDERRLLAQLDLLRSLLERGLVDVSDVDFGKMMKDWLSTFDGNSSPDQEAPGDAPET
jgi:hypothetical protein